MKFESCNNLKHKKTNYYLLHIKFIRQLVQVTTK